MKIKATSFFKDQSKDHKYFESWVARLEELNQTKYSRINVTTSLGATCCWGINTDKPDLKTLVIFPGYRTCSLFWDFNNALEILKKSYRLFLVDPNGQPCFSNGDTPDIKSNDYGTWATEVFKQLGIEKAVVAGASFGALVCIKLSLVAPHLVDKAILLNPGCLAPFSLSIKNLYYNLLPIIAPSSKNVSKFLDKAVFCKPNHQLSAEAEKLIIDYEVFALKRFVDKGQKPYPMDEKELGPLAVPVYLLVGDHDLLFPYATSLLKATSYIKTLQNTFVLKNTGHGIETSTEAISIINEIMQAR